MGGSVDQKRSKRRRRAVVFVTHLCLGSRDQPRRGPAVALTPPLLNSISAASSRLKEVEWLLFSLRQRHSGDEPKRSPHVTVAHGRANLTLPAEELPEASGLLLGLGRRRQSSAIVWLPLRDAGQVQVLCAFTLRLSWKRHPKHQFDHRLKSAPDVRRAERQRADPHSGSERWPPVFLLAA